MDFQEIEGEKRGSKVLTTDDHHLYRFSKGPKAPYLKCYLETITKTMQKVNPDIQKCKSTAIVKDHKIYLTVKHNHIPDKRIYARLLARKVARDGVASSAHPTRQAFDDALREQPGAELVAWGEMYRTLLRDRRDTYPPPPENCESADSFMKDERYSDKQFARYYQGIVSGIDEEKALVFAHPNNLSKLNENTKQIHVDGTFRTAPAMRVGHFYQILIIMAIYKEHMFPVVKAIMTNKTRSLYQGQSPSTRNSQTATCALRL